MKAYVYKEYGSAHVLKPAEVEKPIPKENEVLIKIAAVSVNMADLRLMRGVPRVYRLIFGLFKPKWTILGADIAGRIEAVGGNVKKFKAGDEVFGFAADHGFGGFAEYVCTPIDMLALKPSGVTFEDAAAVPMAAVAALKGIRDKGHVQPGQSVLINGASGGVGTFAVQIAKYFGAEVTAVCSTGKMDLLRSIGADHVIDYTKEDFTKNGLRYDLIAAVNGFHPLSHYKRALKKNGIYVMMGGSTAQIFQALLLGPFMSLFGGKKIVCLTEASKTGDLEFVSELLTSGKIKPVIDKRYKFNELPEAVRYCDEEHPAGKVVISIA